MYVIRFLRCTYSGNIELTVAALGEAKGDLVFKAADGAKVVFTGTITLGYRDQGTGAAMYDANVTFDGIIFDHANAATHSIDLGDVKSLNLVNCTIIGDGEYGLTCARGNATGVSKIVGCTFENAAMQLLGNFATGLVIDDCTFNNSRINVQAGNGVTVQNCEFNLTLDAKHVGDSFYAIRSNSTPITVKNCEINVDSKLTDVATAQAKWYLLANRGTTNWTVENVAVTLTAKALAQTELVVTACTSTGKINTTNVTVNGVIVSPITNVEPAPYEGTMYDEGSNVVSYKDITLGGDSYISIDNNASVAIEGVTADVNGSVIVMDEYQPAIFIQDCEFTIEDGNFLIDASAVEGGVYQIFIVNVKVNGEYLTQETAANYLNNVNWYQALVVTE